MYNSDEFSDESDGECGFQKCRGGVCSMRRGSASPGLPFDPAAIQNIILNLSDQFDMRVVNSDIRINSAMLITGGLALAGSILGKQYGGNTGAVLGGAVGGACGLGIAVISLRDIWEDVKCRLWELYEITYDYMAGMGLRDYEHAASVLITNSRGGQGAELAQILAQVASRLLKNKVMTSIMTQD